MPQISTRIPEELSQEIDRAARQLRRSRAEVVRQALSFYLEDLEDLRLGLDALNDPDDPVLEWEEVRSALLDPDQA